MGPPPKPIVEFPQAAPGDWIDPPGFAEALRLHISRHGDTPWQLARAIGRPGEAPSFQTILGWTRATLPRKSAADSLRRIARRYRLPDSYFLDKVAQQRRPPDVLARFFTGQQMSQARWHVPHDFAARPLDEQREIADWIKRTIIIGGTDYRSYLLEWTARPYALRFPHVRVLMGTGPAPAVRRRRSTPAARDAPARLCEEMADLVRFKTRTLTLVGDRREWRWIEPSAAQAVKRFSLMFGALSAPPNGELRGRGIPESALTMALLVLPDVWDWYVEWHRRKRGFYTTGELELMDFARAITRPEVGWLRQRPEIAASLGPVPDLLSEAQVKAIRSDWDGACQAMHTHARQRRRDLRPLTRVHRDPFEPILPVLTADNPLAEYRRITSELLARLPCSSADPRAAAEAVRGYLMLRFGLHLGFRQKNLREMLLCPPRARPTQTTKLEHLRCGELRWLGEERKWVVFAPALAFKNARSSFFGGRPFLMALPDLERLYELLAAYLEVHRPLLLGGAKDPGTVFVRATPDIDSDARFDSAGFYSAFRTLTERYGVYNPYTKRGAIKGLLPHGPHSVRDVLATHVLKQTGSYVQAGFAIQDAPETVEECYGRFLPEDKSRMAARILDAEWR